MWHKMQADDVASSSSSHQLWASEEVSYGASDPEYAREVACLKLLPGPSQMPLACLMRCQEDPRQVWRVLHKWCNVTTTFNKTTVLTRCSTEVYRPTDAQICHEMGGVLCAGLVDRDQIDEGLLVAMCTESFSDRWWSSCGASRSVLLTERHVTV